MTKLVIISDTHGDHDRLDLPDGDILIHCGDFTNIGRPEEVESFLDWFNSQPHKHKVFICGNHEVLLERHLDQFKADLEKYYPELIYMHDSGVELMGLKFWGSPVVPRYGNWAFMKERGEELADHWEDIPTDTDILITHGPPKHCLDTAVNSGSPEGCGDLLDKILEDISPKVHCFGHIHEGYGTTDVLSTKFVNASIMNERYNPVNEPHVIEIS